MLVYLCEAVLRQSIDLLELDTVFKDGAPFIPTKAAHQMHTPKKSLGWLPHASVFLGPLSLCARSFSGRAG